MSRSKEKIGRKPYKKTDEEFLVIKEGMMSTTVQKNQPYKIRVARWGKFQPVLEKRLFIYDSELLDYIPGRLMSFNKEDFLCIIENQDKIMNVINKIYEQYESEKLEEEQSK